MQTALEQATAVVRDHPDRQHQEREAEFAVALDASRRALDALHVAAQRYRGQTAEPMRGAALDAWYRALGEAGAALELVRHCRARLNEG